MADKKTERIKYLVEKLNEFLAADNLYDDGGKEGPAVKVLILK